MKKIYIKNTNKYGRGIFALEEINKGELIESSPVIILPKEERKYLEKTSLGNYFFKWGRKYKDAAIALGFGSIFNHSYSPNATFENNVEKNTIDFFALTPINPGDEITINYNGYPEDQSPLWFEVIK